MSQPVSFEEVDARLRSLPASLVVGPQDSWAIAHLATIRILDGRPRHRPVRLAVALGLALALIVLGNLGAAYYAPAYGRAVADAPVVGAVSGQMLHFFGLSERNVAALNDASVSSGHTIRLVAGFADGLRTVLFVEIDGKRVTPGYGPGQYGLGDLTLMDQFGHSYQPRGVSVPNNLAFEPLVWPASKVGARLTLHVTSIQALSSTASTATPRISGDWMLRATLVPEAAHNLPLPAPVRTTTAVYTFTSVRVTSTAVHIEWNTTGSVNDAINQATGSGLSPQTPPAALDQERRLLREYFSPRLFDSTGHEMPIDLYSTTFENPARSEFNGYVPGPGRYRLQLGDALTAAEDQIWIVVP
jgi:hypothetical protein